jgi:hypothetical protein
MQLLGPVQDTSLRLASVTEPLLEAEATVVPAASAARQQPAEMSPRHPNPNALRDTVALLTAAVRGTYARNGCPAPAVHPVAGFISDCIAGAKCTPAAAPGRLN